MSHRVITTLVGVTLGGLLVWGVFRSKRRKTLSIQKAPDPPPPVTLEEEDEEEEEEVRALEERRSGTAAPPPPPAPASASASPVPSPEQLLSVTPLTVSSEEEWLQLWPRLQAELSFLPVLGLDCEWVSVKGRSSAVSLLQLASHSGLCVLVRLLAFRGGSFPPGLTEVLADPHVLKVGVGCYEDGKRLSRDYALELSCTVDLRYLALRQRRAALQNGLSLKSLAADLLNVSLDKSLELRCSNWEAEQLTEEQMAYAARDAQVSVALFLRLLGLAPAPDRGPPASCSYPELAARCQGLLDVPFRGRGGDGEERDGEQRRRRPRKTPSYESPESGDQQVPDTRKNKRKTLGAGYSARKSPLYDNCFLHAPDGQPLCTCDKKKAKWYLDKGIGVLQSEDPFVVRLLFEPSGRPDSQQDYYLTAKQNLCVVCGKADSYIRKNIVPHEYRRHFPTEMKDHNSHDILLLCTACHADSNLHDAALKQQLAEAHAAPQGCEEGVRLLEDSDRRRVRSAARALLSAGAGLPEARRAELRQLIRGFLQLGEQQPLSEEALQHAAALETRIFNEAYIPHGLKVVRAHAERGLPGLMELERRWRQHFLGSMRPRHLPPLWAVDHNHHKLLRKHGADLPIKLN